MSWTSYNSGIWLFTSSIENKATVLSVSSEMLSVKVNESHHVAFLLSFDPKLNKNILNFDISRNWYYIDMFWNFFDIILFLYK